MCAKLKTETPWALQCPDCAAQLTARGPLAAGQAVECPRCRGQFTLGDGSSSSIGVQPRDEGKKSIGEKRSPGPANFHSEAPPKAVDSPPVGFARSSRLPGVAKKAVRRAKFIAGPLAPRRARLAADGRLPLLILGTAPRAERSAAAKTGLRPGLLIAALGLSLCATSVLLSIEVRRDGSDAGLKSAARQQLKLYYETPPLKRYQVLLRKAQQAHRLGNAAYERRLYREVLDMLHAEGHHEFEGLTGTAVAERPPNDRHLEQILSTLLAD